MERAEAEILDKLGTIHQLQAGKEELARQVGQLEEEVTMKEESQLAQMSNDHQIHSQLKQRIRELEQH